MEFDKSKIYTALNADESLVGTKGYFAQSLAKLKHLVETDSVKHYDVREFDDLGIVEEAGPFQRWNFFYLVEASKQV